MLESQSRRGFVKKVAYAAPVVATLSVMPSIASAGSREQLSYHDKKDWKGWKDWKDFKKENFDFEKTKFKFHKHD